MKLRQINLTAGLKCLAACLALFMLNACAFASVDRPDITKHHDIIVHHRSVALPKTQALEAAKAAAESLGFKIAFFNLNMGELRSDPMHVPADGHCDCGTWNGSQVQGSASCVLSARAQDTGSKETMLSINVYYITNFKGRNLYGMTTRQETYQCASLGTVEYSFWEAMDRYLNSVSGTMGGKNQ